MMSLNFLMVLIQCHIFKIISSKSCTSKTINRQKTNKKIKKKKKKKKNFEKAPSLEVVLVQCNFVGNQYQQKSEILYTYTHNKSYAYLLNDVPSNLVFLKTYNAELDDIILTFIDHRPFEIEEKANVTLFINKQKWHVTLSN